MLNKKQVFVVLTGILLIVPAADARNLVQVPDIPSTPTPHFSRQFSNLTSESAHPTDDSARLFVNGSQSVSGSGKAQRFPGSSPDALPGDENWADGWVLLPGTDGPVYAVAIAANSDVYVGGHFKVAGGVIANYIAKWDGSMWSALGSGMNFPVEALEFDADGNLYAGGHFTMAGGIDAHYIAKWNGSAWSALGSGMDSVVLAIEVDSAGNLYVGGGFSRAGGVSASGIAKWNGNSWSDVDGGFSGVDYPWIADLILDETGNLYAGGGFTIAGGVNANNIAKWDGSAWSPLGSGVSGGGAIGPGVSALAIDRTGNLYASGSFTEAGGISAHFIAKWNGSAWSALGEGLGGCEFSCVYALAVDATGNLYAGGPFSTAGGIGVGYIAKWNGTSWFPIGDGMSNEVTALAVDTIGNLYAGGWFWAADGVVAKFIAKWDNSTWSSLGMGMSMDVNALAVETDGDLYVGGTITMAGEMGANGVAKWNGHTWSALGSGIRGYVRTLVVDTTGNLYAGGDFTTAGQVSARNIAKWDGATWSSLGSGTDDSVYSLAVDMEGNLYAGGAFTVAGGRNANFIAKWDGNAWSALDNGMDGPVRALAIDSIGNLYVGGNFNGLNATHIAKWDGAAWSSLGSGMNGPVYSLAVDAEDNLYAGGAFTVAGVGNANFIAKWNGSTWFSLGSGTGSTVRALAIDTAGNVFAGGDFTSVGGITTNSIAKWNGSVWSALGSGMSHGITSGVVYALTINTDANLYVGGEFTVAGDHASAYVARWTAASGVYDVTTGNYTFYTNDLPVTIDVISPGSLYRLAVQRVNRSHPQAGSDFNTGYYWNIVGSDDSGDPATGYVVDLTLPATFVLDGYDQVCRWRDNLWNCGANAHTTFLVMRRGITQLSDWTVVNHNRFWYLPFLP